MRNPIPIYIIIIILGSSFSIIGSPTCLWRDYFGFYLRFFKKMKMEKKEKE